MEELRMLKDKLCNELKEYAHKEVSAGALDIIDKLAHTVKNLDKIIDNHEGYSNRYSSGRMYDNSRSSGRESWGRYPRPDDYNGYAYDEMRR